MPLLNTLVRYGDTDCRTDYLVIIGGSADGLPLFSRDRYCGAALGRCTAPSSGATACAAAVGAVTSQYSTPIERTQ
jgi:hypothetical protein